MASNRLVDRAKAAANRSAAESPTESHQRRYQTDLAHEIGPTTFGRSSDDEGGESLLQVMTQPAMILILAIITFALTFIVLTWRDGRLDGLFPAEAPAIAAKDPKSWMLGRDADGVIEDTQPPGDEADAIANATAGKTKASEPVAEVEDEPDSATTNDAASSAPGHAKSSS